MSASFKPLQGLFAGAMLLLAAGLVGCGSVSGGETVVKYTHGEDPGPLVSAPRTGTYALFYTTDATPQVRTRVEAGEKVGFIKEGPEVTAVAGEYRKVVGPYVLEAFWKYMKEDNK